MANPTFDLEVQVGRLVRWSQLLVRPSVFVGVVLLLESWTLPNED